MTMKELMDLVEIEKDMKLPSVHAASRDMEDIILSRIFGGDSELRVYRRGYVFYRQGRHMTVFSLEDFKADYEYLSLMDEHFDVTGVCEDSDCIFRLMLEGDDRITGNIARAESKRQVSYSAESEEWGALMDRRDAIGELIDSIYVEELLDTVTDRQRELLKKHFFEEYEMLEISRQEGKSRQAISDAIRNGIRRMKEEA